MNTNYKKYLESDDWKQKRKTKYRKSRTKKCAICMAWEDLHVHHLIYKPNLKDVENCDLRILCARCHKVTHDLIDSGVIKFRSEKHNSRFSTIKNHVKIHLDLYPTKEERQLKRKERDAYLKTKSEPKKIFKVEHPEIVEVLTEKHLIRGLSKMGGYSLAQLRLFGFDNFPKKGWQKMVIGQEWPKETVSQFINLKNKHLK